MLNLFQIRLPIQCLYCQSAQFGSQCGFGPFVCRPFAKSLVSSSPKMDRTWRQDFHLESMFDFVVHLCRSTGIGNAEMEVIIDFHKVFQFTSQIINRIFSPVRLVSYENPTWSETLPVWAEQQQLDNNLASHYLHSQAYLLVIATLLLAVSYSARAQPFTYKEGKHVYHTSLLCCPAYFLCVLIIYRQLSVSVAPFDPLAASASSSSSSSVSDLLRHSENLTNRSQTFSDHFTKTVHQITARMGNVPDDYHEDAAADSSEELPTAAALQDPLPASSQRVPLLTRTTGRSTVREQEMRNSAPTGGYQSRTVLDRDRNEASSHSQETDVDAVNSGRRASSEGVWRALLAKKLRLLAVMQSFCLLCVASACLAGIFGPIVLAIRRYGVLPKKPHSYADSLSTAFTLFKNGALPPPPEITGGQFALLASREKQLLASLTECNGQMNRQSRHSISTSTGRTLSTGSSNGAIILTGSESSGSSQSNGRSNGSAGSGEREASSTDLEAEGDRAVVNVTTGFIQSTSTTSVPSGKSKMGMAAGMLSSLQASLMNVGIKKSGGKKKSNKPPAPPPPPLPNRQGQPGAALSAAKLLDRLSLTSTGTNRSNSSGSNRSIGNTLDPSHNIGSGAQFNYATTPNYHRFKYVLNNLTDDLNHAINSSAIAAAVTNTTVGQLGEFGRGELVRNPLYQDNPSLHHSKHVHHHSHHRGQHHFRSAYPWSAQS